MIDGAARAIITGMAKRAGHHNDDGEREQVKWWQAIAVVAVIAYAGAVIIDVAIDDSDDDPAPTTRSIPDDLYDVTEVAFLGSPSRSDVEPLFRTVLDGTVTGYSVANAERLADVLVVLRRESTTGVTEMDLLDCMVHSVPIAAVEAWELAALVASLMELEGGVCAPYLQPGSADGP